MHQDDDVYDIPSVPKFADFRLIALGQLEEANQTIGDGLFDMTGVVVGGMPASDNKENQSQADLQRINVEEQQINVEEQQKDKSNFGLNQLAMFRQPEARRRAGSVEGPRLADPPANRAPRSKSTDLRHGPHNDKDKRGVFNRRSVPVALHSKSEKATGLAPGLLKARRSADPRAMPLMKAPPILQRLDKADPALYQGPETRQRTRLNKRAIISSALKPLVASTNNTPQVAVEPQPKATTRLAKTRRSTSELIQLLTLKEKQPTVRPTGTLRPEVNKADPSVVGHASRERARRNVPPSKGPVRMQPVKPRAMPDVESEHRFRESVMRRERGGDSMERSSKVKDSQPQPTRAQRVASKPKPTPVKHASEPRGHQMKETNGTLPGYHRRPSVRMSEAERAAMFARLSTPRSVTVKHSQASGDTPQKTSTHDIKRRSVFPVAAHPSTKGLKSQVVHNRSNPNSRPGSRSASVDQPNPRQ